MILHDKLNEIVPVWRARARTLVKEHGNVKVNDFTIDQVYGGMRDVEVLVTDISYVDPATGIRLRGFTIPEVLEKLPKVKGATMPYVGGLYYLLLTGEVPTLDQALAVEAEWQARAFVPAHVENVLRVMPDDAHPMTLFSQGILALQTESQFVKRYNAGMKKDEYWIPTLEDSLNLIAKLPALAALIYCKKYSKCEMGQADPNLDWAGNFARRLGIANKEYEDLARLYFI
ncbi:MAG: citrate (Si)-synthase, partial [Anaerolineales bacterium]|nr:citrate (Si)-synthase [Anaerolineales bacterium]